MFTWFDYTLFSSLLIASALIGIYFGFFKTKQNTPKEYLWGGKTMRTIPIAISVAALKSRLKAHHSCKSVKFKQLYNAFTIDSPTPTSTPYLKKNTRYTIFNTVNLIERHWCSHFSAVTILVLPADVFRYGASVWLCSFSCVLAPLAAIFIYMPVFYRLQHISIYEYFEKRFDERTKMLAFVLYVLSAILYFPVVTYAPALAFAAATGINVHLTAFVSCAICVFYTAVGGLKAVVWTDFLQFVVITASLLSIYVIGTETSGGFSSVWNTASNGEILDIFNFGLDLTQRDNFWAIVLGSTTTMMSTLTIHQTGVQKFLSLPTFRNCVWSIIYAGVSEALIYLFCVLIGLEIYAKYSNCDPLANHKITKHDQLLPYYVTDVTGHVSGIPGLFMAAVFSAALSTMSSILNSLSGVIYKHCVKRFFKNNPSEKTVSNVLKLIVAMSGALCTCLVFLIEHLGEIVSLTTAFIGITNGPLLGMFTLGVLFPRANAKGTFFGAIGGLIFVSTIVLSAKYYQLRHLLQYPSKLLSNISRNSTVSGVVNLTTTINNSIEDMSVTLSSPDSFQVPSIFRVNFFCYSTIGTVATIILGLLISYMTKKDNTPVDKTLISPIVHFLLAKRTESGDTGSNNRDSGASELFIEKTVEAV